jgi:hypothetical protein
MAGLRPDRRDTVPRNLLGSSRASCNCHPIQFTKWLISLSRPLVVLRDELLPDFRNGRCPLNKVLDIVGSDPGEDLRGAPVEDADLGSVGLHLWYVLILEQPQFSINMLPLRWQERRPLRRYRAPESRK